MYLSGTNFRLLPEVSSMKLSFEDLILFGSGAAEIGVSGQGNVLGFSFSGNRIVAPDNRFIGTYNTGEPFDFSITVNPTNYFYSINDRVIKNSTTKPSFSLQRFYTKTTGVTLSSDSNFFSENFYESLSFDSNYFALGSLTGRISNPSSYKFRVFGNSLTFYNDFSDSLTGTITGDVTGGTEYLFKFNDTDTSRFDRETQFFSIIDTSIGKLSGVYKVNRVSGLEAIVSNLTCYDSGGVYLNSIFDGSGVSGDKYIFTKAPVSYSMTYLCLRSNLKGSGLEKTVVVSFNPESPINSGVYNSDYVTGFSLIRSGEYLYPPTIKTTGYYYVTGLNWNLSTMLMSSGCSGDLPVAFLGVGSGTGASGVLHQTKVTLSGMYGESTRNYYLPQSFEMVSGGTGYLTYPMGILKTGVYANCYDVAARYNSRYLIFSPFSGSGHIAELASYLTGEVLTATGLVSGNQRTGYYVTGLEFTNIGSGYSTGMFPRMSFVRASGDTLTGNATGDALGAFLMKNTGFYLTTGHWSIFTGSDPFDLIRMDTPTGTGYLTSSGNYLYVQVDYSGLDNTRPIVAKLSVSMEGSTTIDNYITGTHYFDTYTGYLKKKDILALTTFNEDSALSFLLTDSQIEEYYSSDGFINNDTTIDVGDLDF